MDEELDYYEYGKEFEESYREMFEEIKDEPFDFVKKTYRSLKNNKAAVGGLAGIGAWSAARKFMPGDFFNDAVDLQTDKLLHFGFCASCSKILSDLALEYDKPKIAATIGPTFTTGFTILKEGGMDPYWSVGDTIANYLGAGTAMLYNYKDKIKDYI